MEQQRSGRSRGCHMAAMAVLVSAWLTGCGGAIAEERVGDQLALDSQKVYAALCTPPLATGVCELDAGGPIVDLARVSAVAPAELDAGGTAHPLMQDRLMLVFTWSGFDCGGAGGASGPRVDGRTPAKAVPCVNRNYVDAQTGEFVYASVESEELAYAQAPAAEDSGVKPK